MLLSQFEIFEMFLINFAHLVNSLDLCFQEVVGKNSMKPLFQAKMVVICLFFHFLF